MAVAVAVYARLLESEAREEKGGIVGDLSAIN